MIKRMQWMRCGVMNEEHETTMIPVKDKDDTKGIERKKKKRRVSKIVQCINIH